MPGARQGPVWRFCPTAEATAQYNPLAAIQWGTPHEPRTLALCAQALVAEADGVERSSEGQHFTELAQTVLQGLIVSGWGSGRQSLGALYRWCTVDKGFEEALAEMAEAREHPAIAAAVHTAADLAAKEPSGVVSTVRRALALFADPLMAQATSESDWTPNAKSCVASTTPRSFSG